MTLCPAGTTRRPAICHEARDAASTQGAALSDPANTFPVLAAGFGMLAAWRYMRTRQWRGAAATWLLLALCFGGVAVWLRLVRG